MSDSKATRLLLSDAVGLTTPQFIAFRECGLLGDRAFGVNDGHRGTRQQSACGARILRDMSRGSFSGYFVGAELDWLLPRAIGTSGASPWIPTNTIAPIYALVDKVAAMWLYNAIRITSFEFSSSETQYINWMFNLVGGLEEGYLSVWPVAAPAFPACGVSLIHSDLVFTYGGTVYPTKSIRCTINNALDDAQFENAVTPTRFEARDLDISLEVTLRYGSDTKALHRAALAGAEASIAMNDGTSTYSFLFGNLKIPTGGPTVPVSGGVNQTLQMKAYRKATITSNADDNQLRITKV